MTDDDINSNSIMSIVANRMTDLPIAHRRPQRDSQRWRPAIALFAVLLWIVVIISNTRTRDQSSPMKSRSSGLSRSQFAIYFPRTDQNEQWKTRRKHAHDRALYNKIEWDEDDDDDKTPFHLDDDDTTTHSNNTNSNSSETHAEVQPVINTTNITNDIDTEKKDEIVPNEKEEQKKKNKDEGIIYSDKIGSKESDPPLPPRERLPPPPPPPPLTKNVDDAVEKKIDNEKGSSSTHTTNTTHDISNKDNQKNNQQPPSTSEDDDSPPADTVIDDLLRGFMFAALFCLCVACLYSCCCYACARCGLLTDERVMEARWRRWQLKKKRSYRKAATAEGDEESPPLDTRRWAAWMAKRADMGGGDEGYHYSTGSGEGVWETLTDDLEQVGSVCDNGKNISAQTFVEFDWDGVEMAVWEDNNNGDAASSAEIELEYGEGDELEDASHDSRLFDGEDGGEGMQREADKFFKVRKDRDEEKRRNKETKIDKSNDHGGVGADGGGINNNDSGTTDTKNGSALSLQTPTDVEQNQTSDISEDSLFNVLQPTSRKTGTTPPLESEPEGNGVDPSSFAIDFVKSNNPNILDHDVSMEQDNTVGNRRDNTAKENTGFRSSMLLVGDRGYDEETDLLGLRSDSPPPLDLEEILLGLKSDSPPPLDLEEIEKNSVENMEDDKCN